MYLLCEGGGGAVPHNSTNNPPARLVVAADARTRHLGPTWQTLGRTAKIIIVHLLLIAKINLLLVSVCLVFIRNSVMLFLLVVKMLIYVK